MRLTLILIGSLLVSTLGNGQSYYYFPNINAGHNPGSLNNDDEYPVGGGLPAGWSTILIGASPSATYSAVQTIPFTFEFAGSPVTKYKVSNSGILTFAIGTAISPGSTPTSLPSASVPDSAVAIWGINGSGANDNIVTKTFGSTPNRQHWIQFSSYSIGAYYTYWSIVLEETTNKIYVVDQRHQTTGNLGALTVGVQTNSTTAIQVSTSPFVPAYAGVSPTPSDNSYYEFTYGFPPNYDLEGVSLHFPAFPNTANAPFEVHGMFRNKGVVTVTSVSLHYSVDGGSPVTATLSGLTITAGETEMLEHPTPWSPSAGYHTLQMWSSNINSNPDENPGDDTVDMQVAVSDPRVNLVDVFLGGFDAIQRGSSSNGLDYPRDLDFHPDYNQLDLWVINRKIESSGGSTTIYSNAGTGSQTSVTKQDQNAWHFMSLPSGIAFSDNGNFSNSPGVYDANHDGGQPFTGPALWSSDPAIYAQPSGGNGSHLDMLHESPYSMGIAWEADNAFWVFDSNLGDICRYDFGGDHGPGNDDHSDGRILRYPVPVSRINLDIPCHLALDDATNWLYIVDGGSKRILRLDITSGTIGGNPSFGPHESVAQYKNMTGITWEVVADTGLVEPAGIDVIGDRLIVSDHSNGDIVVYDISTMPAVELGRIYTGDAGIMGITIAPNGNIWYVNGPENKLYELIAWPSGLSAADEARMRVHPNPASHSVTIDLPADAEAIVLRDMHGRTLRSVAAEGAQQVLALQGLDAGTYVLSVTSASAIRTLQLVVVDD